MYSLIAADGFNWFGNVAPVNLNRQAVKRAHIAGSIIEHVTRQFDDSDAQDGSGMRSVYAIDTDTLKLTEFRGSQGAPDESGNTVFATVIYNTQGHGCSIGGKVHADGSITWETYAD